MASKQLENEINKFLEEQRKIISVQTIKTEAGGKYRVLVDDNFHYMDESERYCAGEYDTEEEAVNKCKAIVESSLEGSKKIESNAADLYASYTMFGEDPFIMGPTNGNFSAWDYAKQRSKEIYPGKD
jgi:hypothetical protein